MTTRSALRRRVARGLPALTILVMAAVLTSCIKIDMEFTVEDQTVSGPLILAVDKQALDFAQQLGEDASADDILGDLNADLDGDLAGVSTEPYEDARFVGSRYVFDNVSLDDLNASWREDGGAEALQIVYHADSDTYEVTGAMDLSEADQQAAGDAEEFFPPNFMEALMGTFDMRLSFTFPGQVLETTGEVSGTTVTWTPTVGQRIEVHAIARASGDGGDASGGQDSGSSAGEEGRDLGAAQGPGTGSNASASPSVLVAVLIALGVAIVAGAIGLGIWLIRRSGGQSPAPVAGATVPGVPLPAGPGQAPPPMAPAGADAPTQAPPHQGGQFTP